MRMSCQVSEYSHTHSYLASRTSYTARRSLINPSILYGVRIVYRVADQVCSG